MMAVLNVTNLPTPRVPFIDERTGQVSREWYRWFVNIFLLTGSGQSDATVVDLLITPPAATAQEAQAAEVQKQVEALALRDWNVSEGEVQKQVAALETIIAQQSSELAEIRKLLQALELAPPAQADDKTKLSKLIVGAGTAAAPSITTEGDEDTGVYFPAVDKVAITTGGVERFRFGDSGDVAMAAAKRFYLDGVTEAGDTYLIESAANVVDLYVGGVKALSITTTGAEVAGHPKLEGVTATGATGTGKLVFDTSPTLVTPDLGTPSVLVGTNITGTAAGLSVNYATSAGSAPTSGVTGFYATFTDITFANGLVTAYTP